MEQEKIIDQWTGAELKPGKPDECEGNGEHPDFEICCDECDYYLLCFPDWKERLEAEYKPPYTDTHTDKEKEPVIMDKKARHTLYSGSVLPGWWNILDKYVPQILAIAPDAELYIKEKFGLLRLDARSETINWTEFTEIENAAEIASSTVCECCGAPGKRRTERSWIQTLCDRCNSITDNDKKRTIIEETEKQWLEKE